MTSLTMQGRVVGEVNYREGEGMMLKIPPGPCEIALADIDVTITWVEDGVHGATAIPRSDYDEHLARGVLVID